MERNFHVFYALLAGASDTDKGMDGWMDGWMDEWMDEQTDHYLLVFLEKYHLLSPEAYHYLNQSGCVSDPTINDQSDFARMKVHMFVIIVRTYNIIVSVIL